MLLRVLLLNLYYDVILLESPISDSLVGSRINDNNTNSAQLENWARAKVGNSPAGVGP